MALELNKSKQWAKELNQSRLGRTRRGQSSRGQRSGGECLHGYEVVLYFFSHLLTTAVICARTLEVNRIRGEETLPFKA